MSMKDEREFEVNRFPSAAIIRLSGGAEAMQHADTDQPAIKQTNTEEEEKNSKNIDSDKH